MTQWLVGVCDINSKEATYSIEAPELWTEERISICLNQGTLPEECGLVPLPVGSFVTSIKKKHGGSRSNSGRKKGLPTKAVRVSQQLAENLDKVQALLALVSDWQARQEDEQASKTSPRWERMNEFLEEVKGIGL